MKSLFIMITAILSLNSFASFNRFWLGHKKAEVSTEAFLNGLNKTFFKDTIAVGKGRGLASYQPYITKMTKDVPDELALVIYENEEKYRTIRNTPQGQAYSALHWDYFDKESSKSTVTKPFEGKLAIGEAYELNPSFQDWQKGKTYVAIYSLSAETDLLKLAKEYEAFSKDRNINGSMLLVTGKWVIEYRSTKDLMYKPLRLKMLEGTYLPSHSLQEIKNSVGFGEGVNFLF